ncbi:hypothetical protein SeMB42_g04832 [Synchytrium endobioticum]|uniref:Uncharacterized protein n=1 Tax=Synchytrium endobioticum TaxID=286115 RepID=A0A507CVD5_9FUNG|nr:hypothetical protein SeMB42_g04832 [Synchytrium endobioticum]
MHRATWPVRLMLPKKKKRTDNPTPPSDPHQPPVLLLAAISCNKTSLSKDLLGGTTYHRRLLDYIAKPHKLADHATHALKLYVLRCSPPSITEKHVEALLYLLNKGVMAVGVVVRTIVVEVTDRCARDAMDVYSAVVYLCVYKRCVTKYMNQHGCGVPA